MKKKAHIVAQKNSKQEMPYEVVLKCNKLLRRIRFSHFIAFWKSLN